MSYASLIKTLPATLGSSTSLAVLASLGIHGLLWAVLPVLSLNSKSIETQLQRTVGLVELSLAEQSRLPQNYTPEDTLPPDGTQPSVLPSLPPPPTFNILQNGMQPSILPPLPPIASLNILPPPTQPSGLPSLPPLESLKVVPPPTQSSVLSPLPPVAVFNVVPPTRQPIVLPPVVLPPPPSNVVPPSGTSSNNPLRASLPQTLRVPSSAPNQNNRSFNSPLPGGQLPALPSNQTYRSRETLPSPARRTWRRPANSSLPYDIQTRLTPGKFVPPSDIQPNQVARANTNQLNTNQRQNQQNTNQRQNQPNINQRQNQPNTNQRQNQPQDLEFTANPVIQPSAQAGKVPALGKQKLLELQRQARERLARSPAGSTSQPIARANPDVRSPKATSAQPENRPSRLRREQLVTALRQQRNQGNPAGSTSQPITRANPDLRSPKATSTGPENTPTRLRREQLVTALRQQRNQGNPAGSTSVATVETIRQLDNFKARQQKVQSEHPKVETKAPIRLTIKTCQKQFDGSVAYIGAVVNPQGKIVSGPDLSSNKGVVDIAQAKARVRSYSFPATSNVANYNFPITFRYDTGNCPEATPKPSPDTTQTPQPNS